MSWQIGSVRLGSRVVLAPLAGYTDLPFRRLVRSFGGVGLAYSEMINPDSVLSGKSLKANAIVATSSDDRPLDWQLYGTDAARLSQAAQWLEARGADLVDVNMGCPQKKICGRGAGAALLRDPAAATEIVRRVVSAVRVPVTVKIRVGWDSSDGIEDFARSLEDAGASALAVHGRTKVQRFSGSVDFEAIRRVVEAVRVPVIANGDIFTVQAALEMWERTGCAAVMIGRRVLSEPWFLRDVDRAFRGEPPLPPPTYRERVEMMKRLYADQEKLYGVRFAVILTRRWVPRFLKGMGAPRPLMMAMLEAKTPTEWWDRLLEVERWIENLAEFPCGRETTGAANGR